MKRDFESFLEKMMNDPRVYSCVDPEEKDKYLWGDWWHKEHEYNIRFTFNLLEASFPIFRIIYRVSSVYDGRCLEELDRVLDLSGEELKALKTAKDRMTK